MRLTTLFRLHVVLAAIYAIAILLAPKVIIGLLSDASLTAAGTDITRLFGAALVLVTLIAWQGSRSVDPALRRAIALSLFVYTTLGAAITLRGQFAGTWGVLGWSSVISYLVFVIGYAYFLFMAPVMNQ